MVNIYGGGLAAGIRTAGDAIAGAIMANKQRAWDEYRRQEAKTEQEAERDRAKSEQEAERERVETEREAERKRAETKLEAERKRAEKEKLDKKQGFGFGYNIIPSYRSTLPNSDKDMTLEELNKLEIIAYSYTKTPEEREGVAKFVELQRSRLTPTPVKNPQKPQTAPPPKPQALPKHIKVGKETLPVTDVRKKLTALQKDIDKAVSDNSINPNSALRVRIARLKADHRNWSKALNEYYEAAHMADRYGAGEPTKPGEGADDDAAIEAILGKFK